MKLSRVHIQTFRSIVDSGRVNVEEGVTVLIGKNEQGKTNFLKAIKAFNSEQRFSPGDLPNHLRPSLEEKKTSEIPIVTLWFTVEMQDRLPMKTFMHAADSIQELKCTKFYGNNYGFWVIDTNGSENNLKFAAPDIGPQTARIAKAVEELQSKLQAHYQRVPAFAANSDTIAQLIAALLAADLQDTSTVENVVKTFTTSLKNVTAQDQPIIDDIALCVKELDAARIEIQAKQLQDHSSKIWSLLPTFVLHSATADKIPNEVPISDFIGNPDGSFKSMANLCKAAGLSVQKIRELSSTSDTAQREAYEDHYKGTISGGLNEFWTQAEYHVHFRIDKDRLSVSISDGRYTPRIPPSDRSEGFQWYLSFYSTLLNDVGDSKPTVLLLDNPGLELHLDGQRDIKRFLEEKVALNSQVLYVTHSPAMVDPFHLAQVRKVELLADQHGTKVSAVIGKSGQQADLLEPIRSAIGTSLVSSLVFNEWNILVEGAADKPIVEGIFLGHYTELQGKQHILINGSLSETKDAFLALFYHRTGLPYLILLDADNGGRELAAQLAAAGISDKHVVKLEDVFKNKKGDFAMEDILSADFYHAAVLRAYPANPVTKPEDDNRKRANRYEQLFKESFGIGFNKRRVAEAVKKLLSEHKEDKETRDNLGTLSTVLVDRLTAPPKAAIAAASATATKASN